MCHSETVTRDVSGSDIAEGIDGKVWDPARKKPGPHICGERDALSMLKSQSRDRHDDPMSSGCSDYFRKGSFGASLDE